jgi:gluconolactonase
MRVIPFFASLLAFAIATAQTPVPSNAKVEVIASGYQFVEGPVWSDSTGLLFSDIPGNTIYQWKAGSGARIYVKPSSNANGLAFDTQGRLIMAQTGLRRVARREPDNAQTPLAALFNGKKLNSPNDLALKSDGAIFFTDPPFNIPAGEKAELTYSGIYRISPSGNLQLLDSSLALPNGICFTPDERRLFVNNSRERVIYVWDVFHDSLLTNKRRFAFISPTGYADGMKVDTNGYLYCTGPLGVWIFAPTGQLVDTILVPGQTSNCTWGDSERKTLYITSGTSVYRVRLGPTGMDGEMQNHLSDENHLTGLHE